MLDAVLHDVIRDAARRFGDAPVVEAAAGWSIGYRDLDRISDEVAAGLAERGIGDRSVVALSIPSTIDYIVLYAAAAKLGAVTAGSNPRYTARERSAVFAVCGADLVVTTEPDGCPDDQPVEVIEPADSVGSILPTLRVPDGFPAPLPADPDRPVCICFTSGSTGAPKGAWYTTRQLAAISDADSSGAWGGGGHMIAPTEFAHVGYMTKIPWILAAGGTMHLQDRWRAGTTLRLLHEYRMPAVSAVAPQLALLLRHPDFDDYDFSAVRAIVVGAAASPPALVREARRRFGAPYSIRYSSTECGGIGLATAFDADDDEALHTIGRPRPGVDAEIRGPDGVAVERGEVGELWLRSPYLMSGYWNAPEETAETLVDGWLRTGDLARVDEAGCFRLSGRIKEMFVRGGYNVYPIEVEGVLLDHPAVADVALVPRRDPVMGEIGVAVVVPDGAAPTLEDLRSHGEAALAHYKLPEALRIVDALPRNASEKLDRLALAAIERGETPDADRG